jgi:aryl-alcohol dehydrogenase-like predicted oxidoreductase
MQNPLTRRNFLAVSALVPAAGLTAPRAQAAPNPVFRKLGRTGLDVSVVSMGVMISSDPALARAALDAGVNYFDTARSYMGGRNEVILGEGLKGRRHEALVATKCHHLGNKSKVVASVEQSLKALKTDYIDVLQLHNLSSRQPVVLEDHLEALEDLRKAGKIRFKGVTTHSNMIEVMDAAVAAGVYDVVLTSLNFKSPPELLAAVKKTAAAGLGVVAMKVMAGGYTATPVPGLNPYQSALRWVVQHQAVATAIPSMATFEQVKENIAVMGTQHTWRDDAALRVYALTVDGRYCRACGSCGALCPRGADIPAALRALMYAEGYGRPVLARETLASTALPCDNCSSCTVTCRFDLNVPERLATARRLLERV